MCGNLRPTILLLPVLVSSACQLYIMISWFIQNLSNLFLNELRDGALTTSDCILFHMLTVLQIKIFSQVIITSDVCPFKRIGSVACTD